MATAITSAPSLPTSLGKAKGFAMNVGDKVLWGVAVIAAIGITKLVLPWIAKIPGAGGIVQSGTPNFDAFGTGRA